MNPQLYALCRAGTDPAITRALEEASDPWSKVKKAIKDGIDWDQVDDITNSLTGAVDTARLRLELATAEDDE